MTTQYLWEFYRGYGRAITQHGETTEVPTICGRPSWALRSYALSNVLSHLAAPFKNEFWLRQFRHSATCSGIIEETVSAGQKPD